MESTREIAKNFRSQKKYGEALPIYIRLWENSDENNIDKWLGWEYAHTYKSLGNLDDAIKIAKVVFKNYPKFKINTDLLCWCLYEKYIKTLVNEISKRDFDRILSIAEFIIDNTENSEATAFRYTINHIIRFLKDKSNYITEKVLFWLNKINPGSLSDIPVVYKASQKEGMSDRENYYSFKAKVLLKLNKYEECIMVCDKALSDIKVFHYENDIWFQVKKAKCYRVLNRLDKALDLLQKTIIFKEHWSLYDEMSQIYQHSGNINSALIYLCRALLTNDKPEMKVNLYERMGNLLETLHEDHMALKHYLLCKKIRKEHKWNVSDTLESNITKISSHLSVEPTFEMFELRSFWSNKLTELLGEKKGTISNITTRGNAGFIKTNDNSYYFKMSSTIGNRSLFKTGANVRFCIVDSYDRAKKQHTKEAICVSVMKF